MFRKDEDASKARPSYQTQAIVKKAIARSEEANGMLSPVKEQENGNNRLGHSMSHIRHRKPRPTYRSPRENGEHRGRAHSAVFLGGAVTLKGWHRNGVSQA